ncbi:hypothetical protein MD484_g3131, partial [Candolleomyces efflorescens]
MATKPSKATSRLGSPHSDSDSDSDSDTLQYPPAEGQGTVDTPAMPRNNAPAPAPGSGPTPGAPRGMNPNPLPGNENPSISTHGAQVVNANGRPPLQVLLNTYAHLSLTARTNAVEVHERDYRIGLLLLAIQELADERTGYVRYQQNLVQQLSFVGRLLDSEGLVGQQRESLNRAVIQYVDTKMAERRYQEAARNAALAQPVCNGAPASENSAGPSATVGPPTGFTVVPPLFQQSYLRDGRVVMGIPLAKPAGDGMSVQDVQQVGRAFVDAPMVSLNNHLQHHLPRRM